MQCPSTICFDLTYFRPTLKNSLAPLRYKSHFFWIFSGIQNHLRRRRWKTWIQQWNPGSLQGRRTYYFGLRNSRSLQIWLLWILQMGLCQPSWWRKRQEIQRSCLHCCICICWIYCRVSFEFSNRISLALCPFEAVKVRVQTTPGFASGLMDGLPKMLSQEGIGKYD